MSGGFAVKIQTVRKKMSGGIWLLFSVLNFCYFLSKISSQLFDAWKTVKKNQSLDGRFFKAVQRLTQSLRAVRQPRMTT